MKTKLVLLALLAPATVFATTTRSFRVTSYADFDAGEAKGVLISSLGEITTGYATKRLDIPVAFVRSSVEGPGGAVYLGTGDQGELWVFEKGKLRKIAKLGEAVEITSLAIGPDGTVYAGAAPSGKIWAVKGNSVRELCKLDADHVWALEWDGAKKTLYVATGSNGKLFAVDAATGKNRVLWESGQKHLRALVRGDDGSLWVGTSDEAILFHVMADGRARAVHDFGAEEVRAIARQGATLYVAVNTFDKSTATKFTPPATGPGTTAAKPPAPSAIQRKGKGAVFRLDADGRYEQLHALADGYFTDLIVEKDGSVMAASGNQGKVFLIRPDRTVFTAFDFPERQVLTLAWSSGARLLGTGDAGGVYEVEGGAPKESVYTSKVFDGEFPAKFGNLRWHGAGNVRFETRSGNTSKPDKSWTTWQKPARADKLGDGGLIHIASPDARYVQFRISMDSSSVVRDTQLYYLPQNQRARVTEIQAGEEPRSATTSASSLTGSAATKQRSPIVKIKWKVENPDNDEMIYRLYFREESEVNWKPLGGTDREPLTKTEFEWNTESVPDGNYVVKVVASDERANPRELALEHSLPSQPFLVDNRKPEVIDLQVQYPYASGRARDSFSAITDMAYSIDGGEWQPMQPKDGLFDDLAEAFSVKLPAGLGAGTHTLAVRASDAADNVGAAQVTFRVK
jgi:outer membrane protein assembly factor BamB